MYTVSDSIAFGGLSEQKSLTDKQSTQWTIINVSTIEVEGADIHIPLNDGETDGGNTQQEFANAVNEVRDALQQDEKIFIHCAVGKSRSITVLATALAAENESNLDKEIHNLMKIRGSSTEPMPELQEQARTYLRHTTQTK